MAKHIAEDAESSLTGPTSQRYRTGAVARMLRMPAATLRVWERRYRVTDPQTTPSGHRLYSAADVQRLALVHQLTAVGHSIGSLAALDIERLRGIASTHVTTLARPLESKRRLPLTLNVAAVGPGCRDRLQRLAARMWLDDALQVATVFECLADVRRAASDSPHDALIVFVDHLEVSLLPKIKAAARALRAQRMAVVHSGSSASEDRAFVDAGISLLPETGDDTRLADWLGVIGSADQVSNAIDQPPTSSAAPAPPRYDDATLADFAGLSSTIACECPRHLAEILIKLSQFEAYSAQCQQLDAIDAALHAYLGQVSRTARSLFESALEQVAIHEGLLVP